MLDLLMTVLACIAIPVLVYRVYRLRRRIAALEGEGDRVVVPGGVVQLTRRLTAEEAEEFRRRWTAAVSDPSFANRVDVLPPLAPYPQSGLTCCPCSCETCHQSCGCPQSQDDPAEE